MADTIAMTFTTIDTSSSACAYVFALPELLEQILSHLTTKDLLLSQRVSRQFRILIQGSVRLQRKLFFAPDWSLSHASLDHSARPENNRLLLRAFHGYYPTISLVIVNDGTPGSDIYLTDDSTTPASPDSPTSSRRPSQEWSWDVCISFPADQPPACAPAVAYPEASWRRMYLSQPPCTALYLTRRWQRSVRPAMVREGGITMGEFFEETVVQHPLRPPPECGRRKWHESYISSDRDWHFEGRVRCSSVEA